VLRDYGFEA
jgi:hypothetical protein